MLMLLAVLLLPQVAWAEGSVPLDLGYTLTWGGIAVVQMRITLIADAGRYDIVFHSESTGMAGWFGRKTIDASVEGTHAAGQWRPERYDSLSTGEGPDRQAHLLYRPDGAIEFTALPPPDAEHDEPVTPIPPDSIPGTSDLLTGLLAQIERRQCDGAMRVFDGRRRYDLRFNAQDGAVLVPEGGRVYSGPAEACHLRIERIGGYARDSAKRIGGDEAVLWSASVLPDQPPLPVEIAFPSTIGMIRARLTWLRQGPDARGVEN